MHSSPKDSIPKPAAESLFTRRVYEATRRIPGGRVASYREIARAIGRPKAPRAVGSALNKNRHKNVPCHRVIRSDGSVGGYAQGARAKIKILIAEGIKIKGGKIDLRIYGTLYGRKYYS